MAMVESGICGSLERQALEQMFEARKRIFVDLLKWDVPVLDGRFEVDQFDDDQAIYIIVADADGTHLGSARLLSTTRPHILGDLFPELCAGAVPTGEHIFEITRFCLGRDQGAAMRRETRNRLVSALVSFALANGIDSYTGVAELGWLQQILAFGWDCRPLGTPRRTGKALAGALLISITPETPSLLERNGIWTGDEAIGTPLARAA